MCLDVLNQTWSAMYDLVNVVEVFLPQLLLYPNPEDPLNDDAARMMQAEPKKYDEKVRELVRKHAAPENVTLDERGSRDGDVDPAPGTATATVSDDDDLGADAYVSSSDEDEDTSSNPGAA